MSNRQNIEPTRHPDNGARAWAVGGTVAFHALLLLGLLFMFLRYPPEGVETWPPQSDKEIIFDEVEDLYASGEFVRIGDTPDELANDEMAPSEAEQPQPSQDAPDLTDAGHAGNPKPVVSTQNESPMKVDKTPKGPTKEELEAEKKRQEAAKREQAKKEAAAKVKFGGGGTGSGQGGQPDGNSATGVTVGSSGKGLEGRTLERWSLPVSSKTGTIAVAVKVDSKGNVTSASYSATGSKGEAAADTSLRRACEEKAKTCRFSVKEGAPVASGYIIFRIK